MTRTLTRPICWKLSWVSRDGPNQPVCNVLHRTQVFCLPLRACMELQRPPLRWHFVSPPRCGKHSSHRSALSYTVDVTIQAKSELKNVPRTLKRDPQSMSSPLLQKDAKFDSSGTTFHQSVTNLLVQRRVNLLKHAGRTVGSCKIPELYHNLKHVHHRISVCRSFIILSHPCDIVILRIFFCNRFYLYKFKAPVVSVSWSLVHRGWQNLGYIAFPLNKSFKGVPFRLAGKRKLKYRTWTKIV